MALNIFQDTTQFRKSYRITQCFLLAALFPISVVNGQCLLLNGTCVDSCPKEYFIYSEECVGKCPEGWGVADDNVTCVNCSMTSPNGTCLPDCASGTYPSLTNGSAECLPCDLLCSDCDGSGVRQCLSCSVAKFNGTCVSECPEGFMIYLGECVHECPNSTFVIQGGQNCYDQCPDSHPYKQGSVCQTSCTEAMYRGVCIAACPNGTLVVGENNTCFDTCPKTHPYHLEARCIQRCPKSHRYSLDGECVSDCPTDMKFVPGERVCLLYCPRTVPLAFNQVCMRHCPPGTYRILEETGPHCLPYVGLRSIAAVITSLLVLLCVMFGIYMSKQYSLARRTEEGVSTMVQDSEKALTKDDSGRYKRSATIGLIHVNSDRRSSAEQPLLGSGGV